jgi:hypothetical protein
MTINKQCHRARDLIQVIEHLPSKRPPQKNAMVSYEMTLEDVYDMSNG